MTEVIRATRNTLGSFNTTDGSYTETEVIVEELDAFLTPMFTPPFSVEEGGQEKFQQMYNLWVCHDVDTFFQPLDEIEILRSSRNLYFRGQTYVVQSGPIRQSIEIGIKYTCFRKDVVDHDASS